MAAGAVQILLLAGQFWAACCPTTALEWLCVCVIQQSTYILILFVCMYMKTDSGDLDWRRELLQAVRAVFDSEREWLHSQLQAFMATTTQMDLTPLLDQLKKLFQKQVLTSIWCCFWCCYCHIKWIQVLLFINHSDSLSGGAAVEISRAAVQRRPSQFIGWGAHPACAAACKHPAEPWTAAAAAGFPTHRKRTGHGNAASAA